LFRINADTVHLNILTLYSQPHILYLEITEDDVDSNTYYGICGKWNILLLCIIPFHCCKYRTKTKKKRF